MVRGDFILDLALLVPEDVECVSLRSDFIPDLLSCIPKFILIIMHIIIVLIPDQL
jgi:hypothetical protein